VHHSLLLAAAAGLALLLCFRYGHCLILVVLRRAFALLASLLSTWLLGWPLFNPKANEESLTKKDPGATVCWAVVLAGSCHGNSSTGPP